VVPVVALIVVITAAAALLGIWCVRRSRLPVSDLDIFNAIPDVMGIQNTERRIIRYNSAGYAYLGLTPEEAHGRRCYELIGRHRPCDPCATERAVQTGETTSIVKHVPETNSWLNVRAYPVKDRHGRVFRVVEHLRDISEEKRLQHELEQMNATLEIQVDERTAELQATIDELQSTRDRLVETQKLSALGRMAAGFSHEMNTPLGVAITSGSFLRDLLNSEDAERIPADIRDRLDSAGTLVVDNLKRASGLLGSLRRIAADRSADDVRDIDVVGYLNDLAMSLSHEWQHRGLDIGFTGASRAMLRTYPGALSQVFTNLVGNAVQHAFSDDRKGRIVVDIRSSEDVHGGVALTIADNGCGMDPDAIDRLYEPFSSTRIGGEGLGLGLHMVYTQVVGRLGGSIRCESGPKDGTAFHITIPPIP